MRNIPWLKIVVAAIGIYVAIYLTLIDRSVDNALHEQFTSYSKLKNDPTLDSATNRKNYQQRKKEINQQIDSLYAQTHPGWYQYAGITLFSISGWLLRAGIAGLRRKKS